MRIGDRLIGEDHPPYVIAEIGVNHDGSVERALELTDASAEAGADAVKFQLFETDLLMSKASKLAAYQASAGETDPIAMLKRLELSLDAMGRVVERAHALGVHAIVTVFSVELVDRAAMLPWDAYKSASPDIVNRPLLDAVAGTGKPLIVSTGASTMEEVARARGWLDPIADRLAFLQCVSSYPAPELALGGIRVIGDRVGVPVGYSDHSNSRTTGYFASLAGASVIEKHVTDDRDRRGPDHEASLLLAELGHYVGLARAGADPAAREVFTQIAGRDRESVRNDASHGDWVRTIGTEGVHQAMVAPVEKRVLACERDVRSVSRQSLVATRDFPMGHVLARSDVTIKRPGTGVEPWRLEEVMGCALRHSVEADAPLPPGAVFDAGNGDV